CSVLRNCSKEQVRAIIANGKSNNHGFTFLPVDVDEEFGPTWSTHLFMIKVVIPIDWKGKEVHLRWNSSSEATLINHDGNVVQVISLTNFARLALLEKGFIPKHRENFVVSKCWEPQHDSKELIYYVEMACNGLFGALGEGFSLDPPNPNLKYKLKYVDIAVYEPLIFKLYTDLEILLGIAEEMTEDIRGYQALYTANEMINLITVNRNHRKASDIASKFFSDKNGAKAHTLVAMGHCHIDTAWLWTYDETKRKCARSWSSQIGLLKMYPDIVFTCSQMQQFQWMKEDYPCLFEQIKDFVNQGRFIPVGGTWVEMDGLLPDGESFIRQFFYGQKFLQTEFGMKAKEFWLPDTFGYSGQIPQIMKHMGIHRFLTQKISWNRVNKFPHHSFLWEGIDGSSVIAHFPPGDSVKEVLKSVNNSEDKGRTNVGAYLYGLGDGGGGPTVPIIERLQRIQDVDGLPKVVFNGPDHFFTQLELDSHKLCKWVGELYLEMHNGTYTSQAKLKWFNRKLEMLLKVAELRTTLDKIGATTERTDIKWIEDCWKGLLLNQFHDVIPGSCIEQVVNDALEIYYKAFTQIQDFLQKDSLRRGLRKPGIMDFSKSCDELVVFNPLPWSMKSVFCIPISEKPFNMQTDSRLQYVQLNNFPSTNQTSKNFPMWEFGNPSQYLACLSEIQPSGYSKLMPISKVKHPVVFSKSQDGSKGTFTNGILRLEVSLKGPPTQKLFFQSSQQDSEWEVFKDFKSTDTEAGRFYIYNDTPACWDAWDCDDYHLETRQDIISYNNNNVGSIQVIAEGPLVGIYKWTATSQEKDNNTNGLNITNYVVMKAESALLEYITVVDWADQSHKFLKVEFPVNVHAREATYEVQYGHVKRSTHSNTSWDMAQFEVSGHKWVDISQPDRGVSLINDSKYGFQIKENIIKLSLLRSPKAPDGNCDMHQHVIRYALLPHDGSFQSAGTIRHAYEFNTNFDVYSLDSPSKNKKWGDTHLPDNVITTSHAAVIPEVVKLGDAAPENTICIRLYESHGASPTNVVIKVRFPAKKVVECNQMENLLSSNTNPIPISEQELLNEHGTMTRFFSFQADFSPFQIKSFLISV
ncbi:Alpha-mannosidase 2C1, partial [Orchesella cincta]